MSFHQQFYSLNVHFNTGEEPEHFRDGTIYIHDVIIIISASYGSGDGYREHLRNCVKSIDWLWEDGDNELVITKNLLDHAGFKVIVDNFGEDHMIDRKGITEVLYLAARHYEEEKMPVPAWIDVIIALLEGGSETYISKRYLFEKVNAVKRHPPGRESLILSSDRLQRFIALQKNRYGLDPITPWFNIFYSAFRVPRSTSRVKSVEKLVSLGYQCIQVGSRVCVTCPRCGGDIWFYIDENGDSRNCSSKPINGTIVCCRQCMSCTQEEHYWVKINTNYEKGDFWKVPVPIPAELVEEED